MHKRDFIVALIAGSASHCANRSVDLHRRFSKCKRPTADCPRRLRHLSGERCLICHGPDGAFRETLLMEHTALINEGSVIPGNPDTSELYKRLLGPTENGARMPLGQEPLPPQSIEAIRNWILAGAPDWTAINTPERRFIPPSEVLASIEEHVNTLSSFERPFARYFTMTHLYNAGVTTDILREYRKALAKLVNSLSWGLDIVNPHPIDPQETIFYIDLRHYDWDRNNGWGADRRRISVPCGVQCAGAERIA